MVDERRQEERFRAMTPVILEAADFAGRAGVTEDVSASGVRLRTTAPIPIGTRVMLKWRSLSEASDVERSGTVVRACGPTPESLFHHALAVQLDQPVPSSELPTAR